jgi:hypothetical protein
MHPIAQPSHHCPHTLFLPISRLLTSSRCAALTDQHLARAAETFPALHHIAFDDVAVGDHGLAPLLGTLRAVCDEPAIALIDDQLFVHKSSHNLVCDIFILFSMPMCEHDGLSTFFLIVSFVDCIWHSLHDQARTRTKSRFCRCGGCGADRWRPRRRRPASRKRYACASDVWLRV